MEKYFQCNNCNDIYEDIFESQCCGKLYCSKCIGFLVNIPCKFCNNSLRFSKNLFAQRILKSINVHCKYDCGKYLSYFEMVKHLLICDNKLFECSIDQCKFKSNKNEMMTHLVTHHKSYCLILMEYHDALKQTISRITKEDYKTANNEKEEETLIDFASYGVSNNELRLGQVRYVVNRNLLRDRGLLSVGDEGLVDFESGQRHRGNNNGVNSVVGVGGSLRRNNYVNNVGNGNVINSINNNNSNGFGSGNGNNGVHRALTNFIQPLDEVSDQSLISNSNEVMGAMHFNSFTSQETI